jgi:DNA invertase Pin-like site-specific DNA recombinase
VTRKPPPLVYSYLRFSSAEQAKGDSVARQTELRDAWLAKTGAVLDSSLTLEDKGVSGYTGEHRKNADRHALALFLKMVEKGRVPRGSYLVCEALDRLSREHIRPALTLLLNLIDKGIRVVQLSPVEQVFDENVEPMALMMAIMELSRGHSESRMKSVRLAKVWRRKKKAAADGLVMTPIVPGWLRVDGRKIVPRPSRVEVVRRIFGDVAAGRGCNQIAVALTRERVPCWGKRPDAAWHGAYVHKIATSRAVLGVYQPRRYVGRKRVIDGEPVSGYYPAVISAAEWQAAQDSLRSRFLGSGKTVQKNWNPFQGWLLDARDGGKMCLKVETNGQNSLCNYYGLKGRPDAAKVVSFPAAEFIVAVLKRLREVKPEDVAPAGPGCDETAELADRREQLAARVAALGEELETGDGEVKAAVAALRKLEEQVEALDAELARARASTPERSAEAWADARDLIELLDRSPDKEDTKVRLKSALRHAVAEGRALIVARCRTPRKDDRGSQKPRRRLAAVQVLFRSGAVRSYLLYYTPAHKRWGVKATCRTWSFAEAGIGEGYDLRDPKDVVALEEFLGAVDLAELQKFLEAGPAPKKPPGRARKGKVG